MTTRTRQFAGLASAIVLGSLAGLLAFQPTALHAADECLSGPKGAAPRGSHWYYRVDRATKKNCWYVRAGHKPTSSASSSAILPLPQTQAPLQPSVANARAEADSASVGQPDGAAPSAPSVAAASVVDPAESTPDNGQSTVASRWLEQTTDAASPSVAAPAVSDTALNPASRSPAAAPPAAADIRASSASGFPPLLLVMIGALVAAAAVTGVMFRLGGARRHEAEDVHHERQAPWDVMDIGATIRSPPLAAEAAIPQGEPARERHEAVIPDEIVQLLSTLSKEAPA
jgi:hypothetical protein